MFEQRWKCISCGFINTEFDYYCVRCKTPKTSTSPFRWRRRGEEKQEGDLTDKAYGVDGK